MPTPFVPVPNCVRTSLLFIMDQQQLVNTFSFRMNTQPTILDMTNLNAAMQTWYNASWKPLVPASNALVAINTIGLWDASAPGVLTPISPIINGTDGLAAPANVTYCASLRTLLRGRNYRGRVYSPAVASSRISVISTVTTAFAGAIATALGQLMTPANVAGFAYVVISKFLNNLPRGTGINTLITSATGDLTLDSQRRRLPGRGA